MSGHVLAGPVMDRLRQRYPSYHETAYLFVLSGLQLAIGRLNKPRHITGRELAEACRDLALDRWGPLARSVLEYWGVRSTQDFGELVFALVDCEVLVKRDKESLVDFDSVYDFEQVFEHDYPWGVPDGLRE